MPRQRVFWLFLILIVVIAIAARTLPTPRNVDDSFITFRYARNLIEGHGFVYNEGVRTLGTTTPLYTLLMASLALLFRADAFPYYAMTVNALADGANVILLALIVYRVTQSIYPAWVIALVWALAPQSVTFAIGGMETSVNILWMLAATWAFVNGRNLWVGVFAALGLLTRPDAALWILPLGLWQLVASQVEADPDNRPRWQRLPWSTWGAGLVVLLPWVIFSMSYFGSPLPNSLGAKSVSYHEITFGALVALIQRYATPFMDFDTFGTFGTLVGALGYLVLNAVALLNVFRREHRLMPFLLYAWLYFIVFSVANPLMFRWYYVPPLPAWIFGIVVGAWSIIQPLSERTRPRAIQIGATVVMMGLWGGMQLNAWDWQPEHGSQRPAPQMAWHELELHYRTIGDYLHDELGTTAETRVASADIGVIGYFSRATIIDTVGLVTPELSAYYPFDDAIRLKGDDEQNYAIPPALILDTQPDYFVTMEGFVRLGLLQMPEFTEQYTLIREIPTDYYGTGVHLYARNDMLNPSN